MGKILINSGGGGIQSDEVTALLSDVVKNKTALTSDSNDEIGTGTLELTSNAGTGDVLKGKTFYSNNPHSKQTGTLELTGNAAVGYVYSGKTFYSNNPKSKLTGNMSCNSISNFTVSVNSGRRVLCSWKNPTAATGKPYSGVYIRYSTSGNPGKTGGTQIYKGSGNNTSSGGTSTTYINLPNVGTKYYLSIYPYVTCSVGEITGSVLNAQVTTGAMQIKTFTSSTTVSVPTGYTLADIFCVGGGGGGSAGRGPRYDCYAGGGGGSGRTATAKNIAVSAGQTLDVVIGAGGERVTSLNDGDGGNTSVSRSGAVLCTAAGGTGGDGTTNLTTRGGGSGGSGGGAGGERETNPSWREGGNGGSDGSDGGDNGAGGVGRGGGRGQGTTTRAFGESGGTLYAGGGGGGGGGQSSGSSVFQPGGAGGAGGGGKGGEGRRHNPDAEDGANGTANTGGGGGGGGASSSDSSYVGTGGTGGSGLVLIRFH